MESVVKVKFVDPAQGQSQRPLAVGPPLSVELDPPVQVTPRTAAVRSAVTVGVRNDIEWRGARHHAVAGARGMAA